MAFASHSNVLLPLLLPRVASPAQDGSVQFHAVADALVRGAYTVSNIAVPVLEPSPLSENIRSLMRSSGMGLIVIVAD